MLFFFFYRITWQGKPRLLPGSHNHSGAHGARAAVELHHQTCTTLATHSPILPAGETAQCPGFCLEMCSLTSKLRPPSAGLSSTTSWETRKLRWFNSGNASLNWLVMFCMARPLCVAYPPANVMRDGSLLIEGFQMKPTMDNFTSVLYLVIIINNDAG